jgi:Mismatch repair ATPase (MutS family)
MKVMTKEEEKKFEEQQQQEAKAKSQKAEQKEKEQKQKEQEKSKTSGQSSMVKQFLDLKHKHPDALLLFRVGDFYETYMQDAAKASDTLGITLTKNTKVKDPEGKPLAMATFPYHQLDTYLPKLIRSGCRVAICDQLEARQNAVKRGEAETQHKAPETAPKQEVKEEIEPSRRSLHF